MLAPALEQGESAASSNYGNARNWVAQLSLAFQSRSQRTIMANMSFKGPLRVQRPFHPEGEVCHSYVLHPPGGMVSGDQLTIDVRAEAGSHALITTPSAGKVYGTDSHDLPQTQNINIDLQQATLEFLPQETIIFNGARAQLDTSISVCAQSRLVFWDMIVLGRQAGDAPFEQGSLQQSLRIEQNGIPLVVEHLSLDAASALRNSAAGLMGKHCFGSMYMLHSAPKALVEDLRDQLASCGQTLFALTHKPGVVIVRALGTDPEALRELFMKIWRLSRPRVLGRPPESPRIWFT